MPENEHESRLSRLDRALNVLDRPVVVFAFLLPVLLQWIVPLVRSRFWLDETITWWTGDAGLLQLIARCTGWPGSILYNSFILLLRSLGAHSEWVLRWPSLLAVIASAVILFSLARRWFSPRVALAAVVFSCTQPWVSFAAADARPYAFGLLAVVSATWLMLRWLDSGRIIHACAYAAVAALIPHFHMLFAPVLLFHAIFLAVELPRERRMIRQTLLAAAILITICLPLIPQYTYAFAGRAAHTFSNPRSFADLGRQFLPTVPMLAAVIAAALLLRYHPAERSPIPRRSLLLAVLWAVVPMITLFAAAKLSESDLFVGRYLIPYVPGIALLFGVALEYISSRVRTGAVLIIFLIPYAVNCIQGNFPSHTESGNWADAISFVDHNNHGQPALMRSPFPESDSFEWREAQMDDDPLFAPLSYYRSKSEWHPLPFTFTSEARLWLEDLGENHGAALLVAKGEDRQWFDYFRQFGPVTKLADFEGVSVWQVRLTPVR